MRRILSPFRILSTALLVAMLASAGCNSGGLADVIDVGINEPGPETIDTDSLGTNAFVNDSRFGTIGAQFREVRDTVKLKYVRVLFNWNSAVQPSPNSVPNLSFYDNIVQALPDGIEALVVVNGIPDWMSNSANWIEGNPRTTFAESWVRTIVSRYRSNPRIVGFEIWNEPNMGTAENTTMGFVDNPGNYVELLARAHSISKDLAPNKIVLNAATTAINQNFPETINYNRSMRDAGAANFTDKWNIHYYGKQYENVVRGSGVADFLNGLSKGIWITESGAQGVNKQLDYGQRVWPFLKDKIPGIERIYQYQFTESSPADVTYGMKNPSSDFPVSDLYVYLRDR